MNYPMAYTVVEDTLNILQGYWIVCALSRCDGNGNGEVREGRFLMAVIGAQESIGLDFNLQISIKTADLGQQILIIQLNFVGVVG